MTESNEKMLQPELTLTLDPFSEPAPQMQTAQPEPPMAQEQPNRRSTKACSPSRSGRW